uniref:Uncharacterized protein n=1 Tax=Glossina pallidipes TaxID=7398 RepID=A0A1B0A7E9_GLOPL
MSRRKQAKPRAFLKLTGSSEFGAKDRNFLLKIVMSKKFNCLLLEYANTHVGINGSFRSVVGEKAEECDEHVAVLESKDQLVSDTESYDEEDDKADSNSATNDKESETVTTSKRTVSPAKREGYVSCCTKNVISKEVCTEA